MAGNNDDRPGENAVRNTTASGTERSEEGTEKQSAMSSTTRRSVLGTLGTAVGAGLFAGTGTGTLGPVDQISPRAAGYHENVDSWSPTAGIHYKARNFDDGRYAHDGEMVARGSYKYDIRSVYRNTKINPSALTHVSGFDPRKQLGENLHIHIHGHDTDHDKATNSMNMVASYDNGRTDYKHVGFVWDSINGGLDKLLWINSRTIAISSARRLAYQIMLAKLDTDRKVVISGYSLGAMIALWTVRWLWWFQVNIEGVFLMGAAVDNHLVTQNRSNPPEYENHLWWKKVTGTEKVWIDTGYEAEYNSEIIRYWDQPIVPFGEELNEVTPNRQNLVGDREPRIINYYSNKDDTLEDILAIFGEAGIFPLGSYAPTDDLPDKFENVFRQGYRHGDYIDRPDHWHDIYERMSSWN